MITPMLEKKAKAEQENIYMPTRNHVFLIFPFPEMEKLPVCSQRFKNNYSPKAPVN